MAIGRILAANPTALRWNEVYRTARVIFRSSNKLLKQLRAAISAYHWNITIESSSATKKLAAAEIIESTAQKTRIPITQRPPVISILSPTVRWRGLAQVITRSICGDGQAASVPVARNGRFSYPSLSLEAVSKIEKNSMFRDYLDIVRRFIFNFLYLFIFAFLC